MDQAEANSAEPTSGQGSGANEQAGPEGRHEDAGTEREKAEAATGGAGEAASGDEEVGGPQGPEPTRFGDWERKGRCIDF